MKTRIALLSGTLALLAGSATAIPTSSPALSIDPQTPTTTWEELQPAAPAVLSLDAVAPVQTAAFFPWPCPKPYLFFMHRPWRPSPFPDGSTDHCIPWPL